MRIMQTLRIALLRAAAVAILVVTAQGQSILGPPSEANHFIGTPKGWVHPKTPWGEPHIQATLNMIQPAGLPLERRPARRAQKAGDIVVGEGKSEDRRRPPGRGRGEGEPRGCRERRVRPRAPL